MTAKVKTRYRYQILTRVPVYENVEPGMGLKAGHVQVGDEVNDPHGSRHKGDVLQLRARPLDHLWVE